MRSKNSSDIFFLIGPAATPKRRALSALQELPAKKLKSGSATNCLIARFTATPWQDFTPHTPDLVQKENRRACRWHLFSEQKSNVKARLSCPECTAILGEAIYLCAGDCWRQWHRHPFQTEEESSLKASLSTCVSPVSSAGLDALAQAVHQVDR